MAFLWRRRALNDLSARVAVLEKQVETLAKMAQADERDTAARLQDGIDSIMGYQWPPAKRGEEE